VTVYDGTRALVRSLVNEPAQAGLHTVVWDGRNERGMAVGSGIYFYRLSTPAHTLTRKMVLLK